MISASWQERRSELLIRRGMFRIILNIVNILPIWSEWFFFQWISEKHIELPLTTNYLCPWKRKYPVNICTNGEQYVIGSYPVMGVEA